MSLIDYHPVFAVKDLEEVVTKENITEIVPVAQSPLAASTFSSDLTTDVNNILISHKTIHAESCSGQSNDLVITTTLSSHTGLGWI